MGRSRKFYLFFLVMTAVFSAAAAIDIPSNSLTDGVFITHWSITEPITPAVSVEQDSQQLAFAAEPLEQQVLISSVPTGKIIVHDKSYIWKEIFSEKKPLSLVMTKKLPICLKN